MKEGSEYAFSTFPYPGLRPFNHDEADIFFGREKQVNRLLAKLGASRFLAVVGPSGCGKSSLIRAGLIPNLEAGFIVGTGSGWRIAEMRPGDHPLLALAKALLKPEAMGSDWNTEADAAPFLAAELRRGPLALAELLRKKPLPAGTNLLILVDQFEEIFRMEGRLDPDEGNKFVDLLLETLRAASSAKAPDIGSELPVYLILTMRSDFLGDCALFRGLPEAINENLYLTPRLIRDETETAIVGPARVCGGSIDPVLVNRLLNEIGPDPDQLPVLQHALMRMWHRMLQDLPNDAAADTAEKIVTPDDYREIGETLGSSLDSHAKEVFEKTLAPEQKPIAEKMFRCLTERAMGQRDRRRPCRLGEIAEIAGASWQEVAGVADVFRGEDRNFVMPPPGEPLTPDTMLDIGHESLIRQWSQLNAWVSQEAQSAAAYQRLVREALAWKGGESGLWQGLNLERILKWWEDNRPSAPWARRYTLPPEGVRSESGLAEQAGREFALAQEFIAQSKKKQEEELERQGKLERVAERSRGLWKLLLLLSCALVIVGGLSVFAISESNKAKNVAAGLDKERRVNFSLKLKSEADGLLERRPDLAALLYLERERLKRPHASDSVTSGGPLPPAVTFAPWLKGFFRGASSEGASVAFSPTDGKRLAVADRENIQVWDVERPWRPLKTLKGHQDMVQTVVFTPKDGKFLVSTSNDGTIRVWDVDGPKPEGQRMFEDPEAKAVPVAFTSDGRYMASGHTDGTVRLWDFDTRTEISTLQAHKGKAWCVAIDARGRWLATGGYDRKVKLWDIATIEKPKPIAEFEHPQEVTDVSFSPDGKWLATLSDAVRLWDPVGKPGQSPHKFSLWTEDERPWSLAFDPTGKLLAQTNKNGTVRLWDLGKWKVEHSDAPDTWITLGGHDGEVSQGAFGPGGRLYASVGQDGTVRLWDLQRQHPLAGTMEPPGDPTTRLAVGYGMDGRLRDVVVKEDTVVLRDAEDARAPASPPYPVPGIIEAWHDGRVAFSSDGTHMAIVTMDSAVGDPGADTQGTAETTSKIQVIDLEKRLGPFTLKVDGKVDALAFAREGGKLAAGSTKGDSYFLRSWTEDTWFENRNEPLAKELKSPIEALAFGTQGDVDVIVTVGKDGIGFLRQSKTLEETRGVKKDLSGFDRAELDPTGTLLALRGRYGSLIRLLDPKTGASRDLEGPASGATYGMAFSRDGKELAVLADDGTIARWQVDPDAWRNAACAVANRNLSCAEWHEHITTALRDQPFSKEHKTCSEFEPPESCKEGEAAGDPDTAGDETLDE